VTVGAELVGVDGRLLRFACTATDDADRLLGRADLTRVVVDRARFLARIS
jgi:predicted thioesterase